jgi:hypothetical protein
MIDLFGAGDGKPPIPPVRAEIIGDFSATGRRFVARFVVFRHPLMVRPLAHGGRTVSLIKRNLSLDLQKRSRSSGDPLETFNASAAFSSRLGPARWIEHTLGRNVAAGRAPIPPAAIATVATHFPEYRLSFNAACWR